MRDHAPASSRRSAPLLAAAVALAFPPLLCAQVQPVSVDDVTLLPSPFLDRQQKHRTTTVANLSNDALLFHFRNTAGLPQPPGVTGSLGGWEDGFVKGHFVGHYLSAASLYAAGGSGDAAYLAKVNYLVDELAKCQTALGTGYLSAFPSAVFDAFEANPFAWHTVNGTNYGVPYYTIDKIVAGLNDAYRYTGNTKALAVSQNMADYFAARFAKLTPAQIQNIVATNTSAGNPNEFGAINGAFTDLYTFTAARGEANPQRFLALANIFNNPTFVQPLAQGKDVLPNIHANTHIAQVVGFAQYANVTGDPTTTAASANFWDIVLRQHSFANGGNSFGEYFRSPGIETAGAGSTALSNNPSETCNSYNMVRLSQLLFTRTQDPKYAAYIESTLYNHVVMHNNPATGMMSYYVHLAPGASRSYGTIHGTCWCCEGTGIESPAAYADKIYFKSPNALYTNVYIPSSVHWQEKNLSLTQQNQPLASDTLTFTATVPATTHATLHFRVPGWTYGNVSVAINGVVQNIPATRGGYLTLDRDWAPGDTLALTFPKSLYLRRSKDDPSMVSLYYGPVLLAGVWGSSLAAPPTLDAFNADPNSFLVLSDPATMTFTLRNLASPVDMTFRPFYSVQGAGKYSVYVPLNAPAATRTWRGGGMLTAFNDGTNWDIAPGANDTLAFDGNLCTSPDNNFKPDTPFAGITFKPTAAPFTLLGNRLQLTGDILNHSPNPQTIAAPITLASGVRNISSPANAPILLSGDLSGPGSLAKSGPFTLTLTGNNAYTGATTVSGGALHIGDGGATGSLGAGQVSLANNAHLLFNRAGTLSLSAPITGDGRLTKAGPGLLSLLAPASYAGPTTISGGTLQLNSLSLSSAIAHRWSFNNSLADSVGNSPATIVNVGTLNTSLSASAISLAGGARTAADYVRLGANLLPDANSPVTIELWATPTAIQTWSRIFDFGSSTSENLFMSWTRDTALATDRVEWRDSVLTTTDDTNQPYTLNTKHHIVLVLDPSSTGTTVRWYAAPAGSAALGAPRGSFTTSNTLAAFTDSENLLGRSFYSADATASASYDEVRFWSGALPQTALELLHAAGPDAVFSALNTTGRLPTTTDLHLSAPGATFDLNALPQSLASIAGVPASRITSSALAPTTLTLTGASVTTFAGTLDGPLALAKAGPGTLTLAGPNAYTGPTRVTGGKLAFASASALPSNASLSVSNAALDLANGYFRPASLTLTSSRATLAGTTPTLLHLDAAPALSPDSTLDLASHALLVSPAAAAKASTLAALRSLVATARQNNTWNGPGITSSTATADPTHYALALADNADLRLTSFRGIPVDDNALLLAPALLGDANLDSKVDAFDLNLLAAHWQQSSPTTLWSAGDFTGDGAVNAFDLNLLAAHWQSAPTALASALPQLPITNYQLPTTPIPEPASLLFLTPALLLLRRRENRAP